MLVSVFRNVQKFSLQRVYFGSARCLGTSPVTFSICSQLIQWIVESLVHQSQFSKPRLKVVQLFTWNSIIVIKLSQNLNFRAHCLHNVQTGFLQIVGPSCAHRTTSITRWWFDQHPSMHRKHTRDRTGPCMFSTKWSHKERWGELISQYFRVASLRVGIDQVK